MKWQARWRSDECKAIQPEDRERIGGTAVVSMSTWTYHSQNSEWEKGGGGFMWIIVDEGSLFQDNSG